jgi:hypothetical protein
MPSKRELREHERAPQQCAVRGREAVWFLAVVQEELKSIPRGSKGTNTLNSQMAN